MKGISGEGRERNEGKVGERGRQGGREGEGRVREKRDKSSEG